MFGFISTCCLNKQQRFTWSNYYCTLCLALKRHFGQLSRFSLNRDSVLLLLLCSDPSPDNQPVEEHRCSLRRFRKVKHFSPDYPAVKYAAVVSTLAGCVKIGDNIRDKTGPAGHLPTVASMLQRHLERKVRQFCIRERIDLMPVLEQVRNQYDLEQSGTYDFNRYIQPTEQATGFVFREAALHTGKYRFAERYAEIGALYGRLMYLSDACRDLKADRRTGVFNPLQHCFSGENIAVQARKLYEQSARSLARLIELLPVSPLCSTLLTGQLAHQGHLLFSTVASDKKRNKSTGTYWCCETCNCGCTACDCGECCDTASEGGNGCSGCDCSGCGDCCDCSGCDGCCCDCSC